MTATIEYDAARLALLVARAGVTRSAKIVDLRLRIAGSNERLSPEEVVPRLASADKPLFCAARESDGSIELNYSPLRARTYEYALHSRIIAHHEGRGFMSFLLQSQPASAISVYCVGREEALLLPLAAVEVWHRDYYVATNWRMDSVDNPYCTDWPQYIDAKTHGAEGILIFESSADGPNNGGHLEVERP
jgi:hypothetical protein